MTYETPNSALDRAKHFKAAFESIPGNHVLLLPDAPKFTIITSTDDHFSISGKARQEIAGMGLFEAFPPNTIDPEFKGVEDLETSFIKVIKQKKPHQLPIQRYDLLNDQGLYEERFWSATNKPVLDEKGEVAFIVHSFQDISEEVKAVRLKERLEGLEKAYETINSSTPDLIYVFGLDYKFIYANQALLTMWGKTWDQAIGKSLLENGYEPWHAEMHEREIDQVVATRQAIRGEVSFPHATLGRRVYDYIFVPVINDEGEVEAVAGTTRDITELKWIEGALRKSHQRFEAAIEAIQGILWTNDATGKMVGEQKGWAKLTGQSFEEYQNFGWTNAVHPDDIQPTIDAWNEAVNKGHSFVFEHRVKTCEQQWRQFSIRAIPLRDENGLIHEWVGMHADVTEQKKIQEEIRESEERFRKLADDSPMFVFLIEPDGLAPVSYWNRTWLEYTGRSHEEAVGRAWEGIIHPDDIQVVMDHYLPAFNDRKYYVIPAVRVKRKDGQYRWHAFKGNPRYSSEGHFNGYVGVGFDIHEQKLAEEQIKENEQLLQVKVEERTMELERAIQELKRSNANLEEFAYAASHDLKEPVRKIHFFSDRLKTSLNEKLNEEERQTFERMELATRRMSSLIDDLLAYSQVSIRPRSIEEVNLKQLIELVLEDLDLEIAERNATVKVENLSNVQGHHRQLQQVFQNIVGNALKYRKPGVNPEILISGSNCQGHDIESIVDRKDKHQTFQVISIKDNGIGFEQSDAERIFNVFTRLHGNTEFRGTGIGLSIVRKVIENHNGYITAESVPGEGSVFRVYLPVYSETQS
ncbi:MAG: PAS domain-containing sensor histidine kinase [Flavisolibacter sp.]